jgi:hypothetical protein
LIAPVASRLSAAAADTAGGSEMITERPRHETSNVGYLVATAGVAVIVWATNVSGIVSVASRAFAACYLCQTLIAAATASSTRPARYRSIIVANIALAILLLFIAIAAVRGK